MVRLEGQSDYDRLDGLMESIASKHGLKLNIRGWTRKTFEVYQQERSDEPMEILARVESFATTNGEITLFDDRGLPFAQDLGAALEKEFGIAEAVVVRRPAP